jgi:hypothetical protein
VNRLVGRLSMVGAGRPAGAADDALVRALEAARHERTYPVACRNLGRPCELFASILGAQLLARSQAEEIRARIEAVPLKGGDLAWTAYPAPELRDMGDLDLLVRPGERLEADRILRDLGYVPEIPPERFEGATMRAALYEREGALPVHLHWDLLNASWPRFMLRVDLDEVWREVRDGRLWAPHRFVSLCEHAMKHSYAELVHLTDLELASRGVDWDAVEDVADRWGLWGAVAMSLTLLRDLAGVESPGLERFLSRPLGWEGRAFLALARRRRWNGLSGLAWLELSGGRRWRWAGEVLAPRGGGYRTKGWTRRLGRALGMAWSGLTS